MSVSVSPGGTDILAGGKGGTALLQSIEIESKSHELDGSFLVPLSETPASFFLRDGEAIVTGSSNDRSVALWSLDTGQEQLRLHEKGVAALLSFAAPSLEDSRLLSGEWDGTIVVSSLVSGEED